jgi:hypothetical protein
MNILTGESSEAWFGGEVPHAVRDLLRQAASAPAQARGALLWTAQALSPQTLPVYYALYKHHAQRRELALAERAARRGLQEAAQTAGLRDDGRLRDGGAADFAANGPARFWLFTLKALAFIALRDGRKAEARELLARIAALGPGERIGDEVIAAMLDAADGV